ncbi:phosphoribosylanthranilate isomerase [Prochlorococcus marinus]|uniref:phosphoribosylanthranilate isomerase n=1 Tax=Prochlorococcus marinus TaxID=1219 RepID=UPI0022B4948F|nr:phosphoribosylanthranilate isomerase [Prochlorococcus marinus]
MNAKAPTAVKICGITQVKQALEIASIGVNAIGVIGVKSSPRFLQEVDRRKLFSELTQHAPGVDRVWVIADLGLDEIIQGIEGIGSPSVIQLHGNESREKCIKLKKRLPQIEFWKSFRIRQQSDVLKAQAFQDSVDSILLDSWSRVNLGGTGQIIPIEFLSSANFQIPWWLAGGISAEWISEVLLELNPFGIDASSKLETHPGIKDIQKVKDLLKAVNNLI